MGFGALIALAMRRKVKLLGSLIAATLLLLFPLWIWDLGFQLSFLATLGLLVTVPPLTKVGLVATSDPSLIAVPMLPPYGRYPATPLLWRSATLALVNISPHPDLCY